jgi:hypothetical protein
MPVILTLGKLKHADREFKVSLGYIEKPCLGQEKKKEGRG